MVETKSAIAVRLEKHRERCYNIFNSNLAFRNLISGDICS